MLNLLLFALALQRLMSLLWVVRAIMRNFGLSLPEFTILQFFAQ